MGAFTLVTILICIALLVPSHFLISNLDIELGLPSCHNQYSLPAMAGRVHPIVVHFLSLPFVLLSIKGLDIISPFPETISIPRKVPLGYFLYLKQVDVI
jgi:hypothetical protein